MVDGEESRPVLLEKNVRVAVHTVDVLKREERRDRLAFFVE